MLNIVEKYTAEGPTQSDEGVVAIEYVVVAGAVVAALAGLFALGLGGILTGAIRDIVDTIPGVDLA